MAKADVHSLLHDFLTKRAKDQGIFDFGDIKKVVKTWKKPTTWNTYVSKQLKPWIENVGSGFRVKRTFLQEKLPQFSELFSQRRDSVPTWARATYDHVVSYEFLMPLTREDKLRAALDEVFFRDTIDERTTMFDKSQRDELEKVVPRQSGEDDGAYGARVANQLADIVGGYSITHVAGRFRAGDLVTRQEAASKLIEKMPYLIDETTAVVRFIMPCPNSRKVHGDRFSHREKAANDSLGGDIELIRTLFFLYFAEAIASTIQGEQLIWLVERSPEGERIYAWEKTLLKRRLKSKSNAAATNSNDSSPMPSTTPAVERNSTTIKRTTGRPSKGGQPSRTPVATERGPVRRTASVEREIVELKGTTRHWLRANGYGYIADMIDEIMTEWQKAGKTTRRNWWDVLAGDQQGLPCKVAGRVFPVLVAAQRRQKRPVTKNAIQLSESESLPE